MSHTETLPRNAETATIHTNGKTEKGLTGMFSSLKRFNILPQEHKFSIMLDELGNDAQESVKLLNQIVNSSDEAQIVQFGDAICEAKNKAKETMKRFTTEVCQTFITPYDREDMQEFASTLYQITKFLDKIQDRIVIHKLLPFNNDFPKMTAVMVEQADLMQRVITLLEKGKNSKELRDVVQEIDDLEDKGDNALGQLIADVFWNIEDTRELILRKDIYEMMEDVTDLYRDAANLALQIILKHS